MKYIRQSHLCRDMPGAIRTFESRTALDLISKKYGPNMENGAMNSLEIVFCNKAIKDTNVTIISTDEDTCCGIF